MGHTRRHRSAGRNPRNTAIRQENHLVLIAESDDLAEHVILTLDAYAYDGTHRGTGKMGFDDVAYDIGYFARGVPFDALKGLA